MPKVFEDLFNLTGKIAIVTGGSGGLGREIATPDEARKMLGLKGSDKVNF